MNKTVKRQWIAALRSNTYVQNEGGVLRDSTGFDVLGVLCDLHRKVSKKKGWYTIDKKQDRQYYQGCWNILPEAVIAWAGIPDTDFDQHLVSVNFKGKYTNLAKLSDEQALTFKEFAELIERKL